MRAIAAVAVFVAACGHGSTPPPAPVPVVCESGTPVGEPIAIAEGTDPDINGWSVGVSNIWERDGRLSATVSLYDRGADHEFEDIFVYVGKTFAIADRRYCAVEVKYPTPGALVLREVE
jgi:hypothetical protein